LRARPSPRRCCQPRFHGPGAEGAFARPAPSVAIARERKLRPDPISSSTSCRELVAMLAGEANTAAASSLEVGRIRAHHANPLSRASADDPLSRGRLAGLQAELASSSRAIHSRGRAGVRAASHAPPRRGARSAAPEVPSIGEYPFRGMAVEAVPDPGWAVIHRLSPICGVFAGAFSFLVGSCDLDGAAGHDDSADLVGAGP